MTPFTPLIVNRTHRRCYARQSKNRSAPEHLLERKKAKGGKAQAVRRYQEGQRS